MSCMIRQWPPFLEHIRPFANPSSPPRRISQDLNPCVLHFPTHPSLCILPLKTMNRIQENMRLLACNSGAAPVANFSHVAEPMDEKLVNRLGRL